MNNSSKYAKRAILAAALGLAGLSVGSAADITIWDNEAGANFGGANGVVAPGINSSAQREDQETEVGTIANQTWDLEAFTYTNGKLGIVSGFDMKSGVAFASANATTGIGSGQQYLAPMGDIFVRVGSPVDYDDNTFAFNYVIHFTSWPSGDGSVGYEVYAQAGTTVQKTGAAGFGTGTALHNDFLWRAAGTTSIDSGTASYDDNVNNAASGGYFGGNHDILSGIDLSSIFTAEAGGSSYDLYFYTTMWCGNDIMQGKLTVPDGGTTLGLLGLSFTGLALVRRFRRA